MNFEFDLTHANIHQLDIVDQAQTIRIGFELKEFDMALYLDRSVARKIKQELNKLEEL